MHIELDLKLTLNDTRPGIIDLGDVQPLLGEQWPLGESEPSDVA